LHKTKKGAIIENSEILCRFGIQNMKVQKKGADAYAGSEGDRCAQYHRIATQK
jgi:hypothetical protein